MEKHEIVIGDFKGLPGSNLTDQQLKALLYMANEYSAKEAAREMAISPRTVEKHVNLAKEKLGGKRSVTGVCVEAMARGIIAKLCLTLAVGAWLVPSESQPTNRIARVTITRHAPRQAITQPLQLT
ncbi:helix-turn-helix domain-containing protein [Thiopseudomonas alkaliphila]|mgnify:FL=1|uniref:Helix-turn-helix domain-containing protein n=1 Tax=Thiopseudomonas alkaliphila TaxID=1697053 RepID=A0AAW7DXH9_9GAMM|nr:LuxR C-terminal-related transcriptional regulator [Thiopseudomonas alkaliphila]MDM1697122.1 helix-turn-helix domain-containing protein [Thiopseudomonas alkaliphila]